MKTQPTRLSADQISFNFDLIKVLSIILVALGHFNIAAGLLWAPISIALFMFAFASGYFTAQKYHHSFSTRLFWKNKIQRLSLKIILIDLFLITIFVSASVEGFFSWMTLPSLFGMTAIFQWFGIENSSPFGFGLWFFAVLILFYLVYPVISKLIEQQGQALIFIISLLLTLTILNYVNPMPYSIWLTIFGFLWGCYSGRFPLFLKPTILATLIVFSASALLIFNLGLGVKFTNFPFLLMTAVFCSLFSLSFAFPKKAFGYLAHLKGCILEIYFIHMYIHLYVNPFESLPPIPKALISLALTLICAWILSVIPQLFKKLKAA